jgi:hypothetical protein
VSVDIVLGIDAQVATSSGSNVSSEMYSSLSTVDSIDLTSLNDTISNFTSEYFKYDLLVFLVLSSPQIVKSVMPSELKIGIKLSYIIH